MKYILIIFFVIVHSFSFIKAEEFFIYPKFNDSLKCGDKISIQWSNVNKVPSNLFYSYDNKTWNLIVDNLYDDKFEWIVPYSINKKIYFKVELIKQTNNKIIWDNKNAHSNHVILSKFCQNERIISVGRDDSVKIWSIPDRKLIYTLFIQNNQRTNFALEFDAGKYLIFQDYTVYIWEPENNNNVTKIYTNSKLGKIRAASYDKNNREIALTSDTGFVKIIDLFGAELAHFNLSGLTTIYTLDYSDDGKFLAVAGDDGYIHLINLETEEIKKSKEKHGDVNFKTIWSVDISPNNIFIFSGGVDDKAILWDFNTLEPIMFYEHSLDVRSTKFNSIGTLYLSAGLDNKLKQYTVTSKNEIKGAELNHGNQILWAEYLGVGDTLITAGRDNGFKVWRNGQSDKEEIYTTAFLYQDLKVWFPHIRAYLNDNVNIPIYIEGNLDYIDSISLTNSIPIDLLDINSFIKNPPVKSDELINTTIQNDKKVKYNLYQANTLLSNRKKGYLSIKNIRFYPISNYKVETEDGSIEIIDYCDKDTSRLINIQNFTNSIHLKREIISNNIELELNTIVDDYYTFAIVDLNGNIIEYLEKKYLKFGKYNFIFETKNLSNGMYFLIVENSYNKYKAKFIKIVE